MFPYKITKEMVVEEWDPESTNFKIRKGRFTLVKKTTKVKGHYGIRDSHDVRIYNKNNVELEKIGSHYFEFASWIKAFNRYPTIDEEKSKMKTIKEVYELYAGSDIYGGYGVSGIVADYWMKPCVLCYVITTFGGIVIFKTKRMYKAILMNLGHYRSNIEQIPMKKAIEYYHRAVNAEKHVLALSDKDQAGIISMEV